MRIAFALLAHEPPEQLRVLISDLTAAGSDVYLHYDRSAKHNIKRVSRKWNLEKNPGKLYHCKRVKVKWGYWSIVQATLNCLKTLEKNNFDCDYLYLISGSCRPIKPLESLVQALKKKPIDYLEAVDVTRKRWTVQGAESERWRFYHFFSWRHQRKLYYLSIRIQELLGVNRNLPLGLRPNFGSQWWCLRIETIKKILTFYKENRVLYRFFKRSWIPDEFFFQSLTAKLVPRNEISHYSLTDYKFDRTGSAKLRYDDAIPHLLESSKFFARKIFPKSRAFKDKFRVASMALNDFENLKSSILKENDSLLEREIEGYKNRLQNQWHSIVSTNVLPGELCLRIPNSFIIICGGSRNLRNEAFEILNNYDTIAAYGHVFDDNEIQFGNGIEQVAGYKKENPMLARFRPHFFISDLAYVNPGKIVSFCLGYRIPEVIRAMRRKRNLTIAILEGTEGLSDQTKGAATRLEQLREEIADRTELEYEVGIGLCNIVHIRPQQLKEDLDRIVSNFI